MKSQRKSARATHRFGRFLIVYVLCFAILLVGGLMIFWNYIEAYEASQPTHAIDAFLDAHTAGALYTAAGGVSDLGEWSNDRCTYRRDPSYKATRPVYLIQAGEQTFLRATLTRSGDARFGFPVWSVSVALLDAAEDPFFETEPPETLPVPPETHTITLTAPVSAAVTADGVPLGEKFLTDTQPVDSVLGDVLAVYIPQQPQLATYTLTYEGDDGPVLEVRDTEGELLPLIPTETGWQAALTSESYAAFLEATYADHARDFAASYIVYNANGFSDTQTHFDIMRGYTHYASPIWSDLGQTYTAVHANSPYIIQKQDIQVSEFVSYCETCFSCRADFSMTIVRYADVIEDATSVRLYYTYYAGQWKIAYMAFIYE